MPSPRSRFETACRVGAFAILGWLLGNSLVADTTRRVESAAGGRVASRLAEWTRLPAGDALHVSFDAAPASWIADWLGALSRSGHAVSWSGTPAPLALSVGALPDPGGGVRIDVSAPSGSTVVVSDDAGTIDSVRVAGFGATLIAPLAIDRVHARAGGQVATAAVPDSARIRSVLVVGAAGWEGKYIASALEERGWPVAVRFAVAPGVGVSQNAGARLDTNRFAAVVAVDSTIDAYSAELERFVRQGGGLVLAGRSGSSPRLAALAPGVPDARTRRAVGPADTLGLGSTGFYPVSRLAPDAVPIERRSDKVAVAARRVGAGRVIQVGYDDTWRWRMAGGDASDGAHREWWARVVASVAYAPPSTARAARIADEAPLAALVARLGPARPAPAAPSPSVSSLILIILMLVLLIAEWSSRRLRGLR